MPVKRYTVDGEPYDVSDAKEQEFLSKFDNAILVGVLDEETNEVIEQKIDKVEDKKMDFPTAVATEVAPVTANTDAVQQPMTELQARYMEPEDTVLPSVDTSLDLPDPKPKSERLIELEGRLEKAKTFRTTMKGQIIADLNDEIEIEKNLATSEGKEIADNFNSSVDAIFNTNIPYQLEEGIIFKDPIEGQSITELNKNPEWRNALTNKITESFYRLNPSQLAPAESTINTLVNARIDTALQKEKQEVVAERNTIIQDLRDAKRYTATIELGVKDYSKNLSPKQTTIANINSRLKKLKDVRNNGTASEAADASQEIATLSKASSDAIKDYNKNFQYWIDPITGKNMSLSQKEKDVLTGQSKPRDLKKEIDAKTIQYKKSTATQLEEAFVLNVLETQDLTQRENRTVKLKSSFFPLINALSSKGYKPNKDGIYEVKYQDLLPLRNITDINKELSKATTLGSKDETLGQAGFSNLLDDLYKDNIRLNINREALTTTFMLNIDPGSIKSTVGNQVGDKIGEFVGAMSTAVIGEDLTKSIGTTQRMELDALEELQIDYGVDMSKSQRENYRRSIPTQIAEGLGGFVPEIIKFGVLNAVTGGTLATTKFAMKMAKHLKRTKNFTPTIKQQTESFIYHALLEEAKFKTVTGGESQTGGGVGFFAGGQLANKFLSKVKFGGPYQALEPVFQKIVAPGLGGMTGSNAALVTEEALKSLSKDVNWGKFMNETYGNIYYDKTTGALLSEKEIEERKKSGNENTMESRSKGFEKLIVDFFTFAGMGVTKLKSTDFMSVAKKRANFTDAMRLLTETNAEGDYLLEGKERKQKENYAIELENSLLRADTSFYNKDVGELTSEINSARTKINEGNISNREQRILEKEIIVAESKIEIAKVGIEKSFDNVKKSGVFQSKGKTPVLKIIRNEKEPNALDGSKAKYFPESNEFQVDLSKYKPGVFTQEVGHALMDLAFKNNEGVAQKFKEGIETTVNKALEGERFGELGDKTFQEIINEKYKDKSQRPEEYVMNIAEFLQNPKYKDLLLSKGLLTGINRIVKNTAGKIGLDLSSKKPLEIGEKNINRASDLLEFLYDLGNIEKGGKNISKQFEKFSNIEIDGKKLIDLETGAEIKTKAEALKDFSSKELEGDNKDIFSKVNKAYEEGIGEKRINIDATGVMVGFAYRPRVLQKIRRYIDRNSIPVDSDFAENLTDAVIMDRGGVPGIVKPYFEGQKVIKYVKENNPSKQEIQNFAKENGIREIRQSEGPSRLDNLEAIAKGTKAEATLTTMLERDIDKRILGIMQKPEYAEQMQSIKLGGMEENQQEAIMQEASSGEGSVAFLDLSKNDRVSRKAAVAVAKLSENINDKATSIAEKTLMLKFPTLGARAIAKVKLSSGEEATYALFRDNADITIGDKTVNIKARGFKEVNDYLSKQGLSVEGKPVKLKNFNQYQQEAFKISLFKEIEKEAGKLKIPKIPGQSFKNAIPTPEYSAFIDNTFKLYKNYISQSSINKRFNIFAEPLIDSKTGEQAREATDQGNAIFKKKNITPAEWKKYFGGDGTGNERLDGKRRSLIETIAMEIGKDAIMEKIESDTFKKIVEERQTELGNDVGENFISKVSIELDRLPSGEADRSYSSKNLYEKVLEMKDFAIINEAQYRTLINQYKRGELDTELEARLVEAATEAFIDTTKARGFIDENIKNEIGQKIIKAITGLNVIQNDILKYESPDHKNFRELLKELGVFELIPKEVLNFTTRESGNSPVLAQTLGYNGTKGKSTSKFLKDFKEVIEKTVTNPEAKAIWKPVLEAMNIEGNTFFSEISKGANKNSIGQIRNIQSKPIEALSKKDKGKEIDKVYKSNLEKSNKINTLYHNAILKTINLSLNLNKKIGFGYSTARNEAVKKLSPILTNNKSFGVRLASPFTIFKYFIEGSKKNFSNEHLKESAKFKGEAINILLTGQKDITKALEKLNTGYESVLTDNVSRTEADNALGTVFSPEMQSYLKLVGADALVMTSKQMVEKLNEWHHAPSKKPLGDYLVDKSIKESIPPNKTNLKLLKEVGADIKNIKTNDQAIAEMDKIDGRAKAFASKDLNSGDLSKTFNKIIENKTGVKAEDVFSESRGVKAGKNKGRLDLFIPPSAEDFVGLLYKTLGKGKEGNAQLAWYKKNLLDPFARGDAAVTNERNALMRDFKQIKKEITEAIAGKDWKGTSPLTRKMKDKLPGLEYTGEDALRMYIWSKQGNEIPSIDKAEVDAVVKEFVKNPELIDFANKIRLINKGTPYPEPTKNWVSGNVSTDLLQGVNTTKRAQHLEQWQANVDQIFSKENLNKLEGVYGKSYRKAMENMLHRMKTGRNRNISGDYLGGRVTDWVNNSTGAIMFLNQRSAVLQLISASNFVNMSDNNIFKAGTAFANQPQYWSDFKMLFNSEYLKNRRGGLEFNVTESEIADIAKAGGINGVIAKILKVGFTPTQLADSFAIASGGSTFFRNRYKTYLKETNAEGEKVYTEKEAKEKAFLDFKETAEESQQSSRPDKISQQQSGILGRTVLSFANTPSQYARIIKKSAMDLKAGRGDQKTNISKIIYYSFLQNVLFNGLQKALFMDLMGDDDDDTTSTAAKRKAEAKTQNKYIDVANGMTSSLLRGSGVSGNIVNSLKDMGLEIYKQQGKTVQDYDRVADAALGFSPPIRYKYQQIKSAGRKFTYPGSRQEVIDKGFSIDSPALMAGAQVTSALTNIPLDRVMRKINNIVNATTMELDEIQRLGLLLGWSKYDLNIPKDKKKSSKGKGVNSYKGVKFKIPKFKTPKFK